MKDIRDRRIGDLDLRALMQYPLDGHVATKLHRDLAFS